MTKDSLKHQLVVKFTDRDFQQVERVAGDFGLNRSEVIRRATIEGLKHFRDAKLPGSPIADGEEK